MREGGLYEMPKPYDDAMKKLVGGNPQDFLSWVLREAIYTQRLPYELHPESIYADGLIEAVLDGERILAHFEFQSSYDLRIGERLLEYNVLASRQYDYVTVYSYVIYLKDCGNVPQSPFIRESRRGKEIVRFHYDIIELHKITAEEIQETELVGLLPLLPLTKDGASTGCSRANRITMDRLCLSYKSHEARSTLAQKEVRYVRRFLA